MRQIGDLELYHVAELLFEGRLKRPSRRCRGTFSSLEEKYDELSKLCDGTRLVGGPAYELLRVYGSKNLIWLDLDTRDAGAVDEWKSSFKFPFQDGSYVLLHSSTKRFHMYVTTDLPATNDDCAAIYETVIDSMDSIELVKNFDRVAGPESSQVIYIPNSAVKKPILPQKLVENCVGVTSLKFLTKTKRKST